jgi:AraC family transcriptional regulator of arabinose operon
MKRRKTYNKQLLADVSSYSENRSSLIDRPYGMDAWELHMTSEGSASAIIGRQEIVLNAGDMILFPPGSPHYYKSENGKTWEQLWIYFFPKPEWDELLSWPVIDAGIMHLNIPEGEYRKSIDSSFRELIEFANQEIPRRIELTMNVLEKILIMCDMHNPLGERIRIDLRIQRVLNYLSAKYMNAVTVEMLASLANLSPSRFAVLFKNEVGCAPIAYLERCRISQAERFLKWTKLPVSEIAEKVGFNSPFYFSKTFRKHHGIAPREYRKIMDN